MTATQIQPTTAAIGTATVTSLRTPSVEVEPDFDIAIVGLGYVGLPTALAYHAAGHRVLALDTSSRRLLEIEGGLVDVVPSDRERLTAALVDDDFHLSADATALARASAVIICVPTPVDDHLVPDLSALRAACATVVDHAVAGQLLLLTSTTYVGCTADLLTAPVARRGLRVGEDIFVAFSAERIDPGSDAVRQEAVPRVVGGATPACTRRAAETLAGYAACVHTVPTIATAEMTKLLENTFRAVNIALINEFADICRSMDIQVRDVIDAAATKPYGYMRFVPGPGVGGHCIPCDPHYLLWQLRKSRVDAPVIAEAMQQIAGRPTRVVDRVREVLAARDRVLSGARVLVVGVAYKPGVADIRESPAIEIIRRLRAAGAAVGYLDPYVPTLEVEPGLVLQPVSDPATFRPAVVLLHTPHPGEDHAWMRPDQLVLDATYRAGAVADMVTL